MLLSLLMVSVALIVMGIWSIDADNGDDGGGAVGDNDDGDGVGGDDDGDGDDKDVFLGNKNSGRIMPTKSYNLHDNDESDNDDDDEKKRITTTIKITILIIILSRLNLNHV